MTYLIDGAAFFQGKLANASEAELITKISSFNGVLTFGLGLVRGASDDLATLPSATGQRFVGVARATDTIEKRAGYSIDADGKMGYPLQHVMSVAIKGVIAVPVDSDCVEGAPVYLIHTASSGQKVGHFRKDANTDKADLVPGAVFDRSLSGAGLGVIRLNWP